MFQNCNTLPIYTWCVAIYNIYADLKGTKVNQSRTNGPINAHLTIAQVMPRYMKNKKHCCKSFVKISAVAQQ